MVYSIYIHEKEKDMKTFNCTECGSTENAEHYREADGTIYVPTIQEAPACASCYYTYMEERV